MHELKRLLGAGLLLGMMALPAGARAQAPAGPPTWEWTAVPRVVAVGDLHGSHGKLMRLLAAAELIDGEGRWSGGGDHLVVAGDFLDRGPDERPLMDLLRRLEEESAAAGGRVHVLLGNHEVMNLFRDLRYVNPTSYRHFAPDESRAQRRIALGRFSTAAAGGFGAGSARFREFHQKFPAGYFARLEAFNADGEYGSWLLGLPTVVKINDVVYTHGGLTAQFAALGVVGINRGVAAEVRRYLEARAALEEDGAVTQVMGYLEVEQTAKTLAASKRGGRAAERREAAEALLAAAKNPILLGEGPLWYRGNAMQDERLERDIIDRSLELLQARALVVAHSPTSTNRITSRFQGRLFRLDHGLQGSEMPLALVAEEGEILVLDANGARTRPRREFPLGQLGAARAAELSDAEMQLFLNQSTIVDARTLGRGSTRPRLMVLKRNGEVRRAIFKTVEDAAGADRYQHEVAAYRLDRAIGLGMVPVTVLRTVGGQTGSLQAWVDGALDQETAEGYNIEFFDDEDKSSQLALGRVFDALIGNTDRKPGDILGLVKRQQVMLIDHSKAFSTSPELPHSLARALSLPDGLTEALTRLDRESLHERLGILLSEAQIEALLERRDRILARLP